MLVAILFTMVKIRNQPKCPLTEEQVHMVLITFADLLKTYFGESPFLCYSVASLLCPTLCDPMDCSCQAPLSMGFPRQGYWSGLPFPSPGDLPDPGTEARSPGFREIPHPPSHQGYTCNTTVLDLVTISSPVHYSLFVFYVC